MSVAAYQVEVSWSTNPQDAPVWADVTADVKAATISRGRPSDMDTIQQGVCSLRLADQTGAYNPQNPGAALAGSLVPMKRLRLGATFGGTTYWQFTGFISRIEYDPDLSVQETVIEAVDLLEFLNIGNPIIAAVTNNTVSQIIGLILDALGWTATVQARNFSGSGDTVPSWSADGSKSGLQLVQDLLTTDLGVFFIDGQGRPSYRDRSILTTNSGTVATFDGAAVSGMKGTTDVKNIINQQSVTRTGGVTQTASDATSDAQYGTRTGQPINSANLASDTQASSLANFIVLDNRQPRPPARGVTLINRDDATLTQQLARELFDAVAVTVTRGGTDVSGPIQSLAHTISDGGMVHQTTYAVEGNVLTFFTIGVSTIGGPDLIGF